MRQNTTLFFWTRFVIRYLGEGNLFLKMVSWFGWLLLGMIGAVLIVNLFVPLMFWFDEAGEYHAGNLRYLILTMQVLLFLATSVYVLVTVKGADAKVRMHHLAIGTMGFAMSVMTVLQVVYPLLPLYGISCLLGSCILHTFVVNDMKDERQRELEEILQREQLQQQELGSAKQMAYTDSLTGVKNTHSYVETTGRVDQRITGGELQEFGVIVFDLNGLKEVNDTRGHESGDSYIRAACRLICDTFKHSPVFRIGGDEFTVLLEGEDYKKRKILLADFETQVEENLRNGDVVVASGLSVFRPGQDNSYSRVFERADHRMYDRKGYLKSMLPNGK